MLCPGPLASVTCTDHNRINTWFSLRMIPNKSLPGLSSESAVTVLECCIEVRGAMAGMRISLTQFLRSLANRQLGLKLYIFVYCFGVGYYCAFPISTANCHITHTLKNTCQFWFLLNTYNAYCNTANWHNNSSICTLFDSVHIWEYSNELHITVNDICIAK